MVELAVNIFADGPSSNPNQPMKPLIRDWGTWIEGVIAAFFGSGGKIYQTKAALTADLVPAANSSAWVMEDPVADNNGVYRKVGGTGTGLWVRAGDLPFSFIIASDVGAGTPNAIQATTSIPVSSSALIWTNIFEANTSSPVTISFNGGAALTMKTNTGNNISAGGLVAGMIALGTVSAGTFRLLNDQVSSAIVAAAEAAADRAEAAALSVVSYIQSPLKVSFFCQGDGTDENTKLANFFAELVSKKVDGVIDLPVRFSTPKTLTAYIGELSAAGQGRLISTTGAGGLVLDYSGVTSGYGQPSYLSDITILTEADGLGTAFTYIGSDYLNTTQINSLEWRVIRASGVDDTKGWAKHASLQKAQNSAIYSPQFQGRSDIVTAGYAEVGFEFFNGCNGVDIYSPRISWVGTCIRVPDSGVMTEAIRIKGGFLQASRQGFVVEALGAHHISDGAHYDVTRVGILFGADGIVASADFSSAVNNFIIRSEAELGNLYDSGTGQVRDFIGIWANYNEVNVSGNSVWSPATAIPGAPAGKRLYDNTYGIIAGSLTDANKRAQGGIGRNNFKAMATPVHLRTTSRYVTVSDNMIDMNGNANAYADGIRNDGQSNMVGPNVMINNSGAVTYNKGSAKTSPISEAYTTATLANATGDGTASNMAPMTVTLNDGSGLASNGMYTAPLAGWYRMSVQVQFELPNSATGGSIIVVAGCNPADGSGGTAFTYAVAPSQGFVHMSGLFHLDKGKGLYAITLAAGTTKTIDVIGGAANTTRITVALDRAD